MYCTNTDMGGDPRSPRGDGRYRPVLARGDGHLLYLMARSTVFDRDWRFDNDLARFGDPWNLPRTATGRKGIPHPIGPALVWAPLLVTAHAGATVANAFGAEIQTHGYTAWHQRFVFFSSVVFACGAVFIARRVAMRALGGGAWASSYASIAVLLGTSITYYATHMPSYGHAMDAFACAAFLGYWASTIGRLDLKRFVILGVLLGVAMLVRIQESAMGIVVALELAIAIARAPRKILVLGARGALAVAVALVVFVPQLIEFHIVYGSAFGLPQGPAFTRLGSPMVMEVLFAPGHGWLSSTPIAYAGVVGLFFLPRAARLIGLGFLAAIAIQVYLNSTVFDWWAGASFGARRMCNATLPIAVGLAALIWRFGRLIARRPRIPLPVGHAIAVAVLGVFVAINLVKVSNLDAGKPAPESPRATCCRDVPAPLRGIASSIYDTIGNPFQFPASALFALEHGVGLERWDQVFGRYAIVPPLPDLTAGTYRRKTRGGWPIASPQATPWILRGLSPPASGAGRPLRWTTERDAAIVVAELMPDAQTFTLWLAPGGSDRARVLWDGDVVADVALVAGWNRVEFSVDHVDVGFVELAIEAAPSPMPVRPGFQAAMPVGVGVSNLEITFE